MPEAVPEPSEAIEIQAAESRIAFVLTGAFTVLLAGTLYYVYDIFEPLAPPGKLNAWAGFMAGVTLIMAVVPVVVYLRRPDDAELVRVWDKVGKAVAVLYDLAVASSVWLLLPYASEPLQLLMVIFYSAAISGQVISTAESTDTIVFGVLAIFGSAAWFFLQTDSAYSISLAVFLMAFGAMLIGVSLALKQAIRTAIRLRLKAERISEELAAALEEAREARDARTRFIAAASHDLRQPLQAAALFFEQLRGTPSPAQRERAEDGVRLGLAEANSLLERMLEHLKLESGTLEAQVAQVPLAPLFEALVAEHRLAAEHAGMRLRAMRTRLAVLADRTLLTRILRNLIHNALAHSRGKRVRLLARGRGSVVELFVVDDGSGVTLGRAERLFAAYTQGRDARAAGRGMGLGLAVAREMARLMGGDLDLHAGWLRGAAFRLHLPAAPPTSDTTVILAEQAAGRHTLAGLRVLVVDDDHPAGEALAGVLAQHGADTRHAPGVAAIVDLIASRWSPDLVVSDWHLGDGVTAGEVIDALRESDPGLPAVIMTGDGSRETLLQLDALDLQVFWKPVPSAELIRTLADMARRRPPRGPTNGPKPSGRNVRQG